MTQHLDGRLSESLTGVHQAFETDALTQLGTASQALQQGLDGIAQGAEGFQDVFDGQLGTIVQQLHGVIQIIEQIKPILDMARRWLA